MSNYCMIVPLDSNHVASIEVDDEKNQYIITPATSAASLKGWRVDFKNQTGQVTSEDNGSGKGNTVTGTGRVEIGIDKMAVLSRTLSNLDGDFLAFFPTGNSVTVTVDGTAVKKKEWLVVGNPTGDISWSRASDTGAARGDDHGTTFTVVCDYQVYDTVKYYGDIDMETEA